MGTVPPPNIVEAAGQIAEAPQNALAEYARASALRQQTALSQQQTQGEQLQNQQRQQQLNDQQAMTQAMHEWDGKDFEAIPSLILKHGGSANAMFTVQQKLLERKTQLANLDKDQLANQQGHNDVALGAFKTLNDVSDEELPTRLPQMAQDLASKGHIDPQHVATANQIAQQAATDPVTARQQLSIYEKGLMGEKEQFSQAQAAQESKVKQQEANVKQQQANAGDWKELPGMGVLYNTRTNEIQTPAGQVMSPAMLESKYIMNGQKARMGQVLSPQEQAFQKSYEHMKTLVPVTNISLQGGLLSQQAKDMAAQQFAQTGQLPQGMRSPAMSAGILNTAAGAAGGTVPNIAANKAAYQADAGSLKNLQKNFDQVSAFENTAGKNLDLFLDKLSKISDLGVKFANVPMRMIDSKMIGSDNYQAMKAAQQVASAETAKVLSSANASGVLSDSQKKEAEDMLSGNLSYSAAKNVVNTLKQDFSNRHQSYQGQISGIKARIGGGGTTPSAQPQTAQQGGGGEGQTATGPNGHKIVVKGGQWVDAKTGAPLK